MTSRLEHANITVTDVDRAVDFLITALPEFRVRGEGVGPDGRRWLHVGSDSDYIALNEAGPGDGPESITHWQGVNHLGFVVDDAEAVKRRLMAKGYREGFVAESHPHRLRIYLLDGDGNEWEFVQYLSDVVAEQNHYSIG
jgi:catechol 2,3-dioxygenase-like lactoylglutathione lyase family enzyme